MNFNCLRLQQFCCQSRGKFLMEATSRKERKKNWFRFPFVFAYTRQSHHTQTDWTVSDKIWNETDVILFVRGGDDDAKAKVRTIWPLKWRERAHTHTHSPDICTAHTCNGVHSFLRALSISLAPFLSVWQCVATHAGPATRKRMRSCERMVDTREFARECDNCTQCLCSLASARSRVRYILGAREREREGENERIIIICDYKHKTELTAENFNYSNEHELLHIIFLFLLEFSVSNNFFESLHFVDRACAFVFSFFFFFFFLCCCLFAYITSPHMGISNEIGEAEKKNRQSNIEV